MIVIYFSFSFIYRGKGFSLTGQDTVLEIIFSQRNILGRFYQLFKIFLYLPLQRQIQNFMKWEGWGWGWGWGGVSRKKN